MKTHKDFVPGERFTTRGRTVTEAHVVGFAGLTGDFYPIHMDETYARQSEFGERIAHGPLIYALAVGLVFEYGILEDAIIAFLGIDKLKHLAPCFIGTTIHVEGEVLSSRPTRDGRRGVVVIRYEVVDQKDQTLLTADMNFLTRADSGEDAERVAGGATASSRVHT